MRRSSTFHPDGVERAAATRPHNHLNRMDEIKKIGDTVYTVTNIERVGALREESRKKRESRPGSDKVTLGRKRKREEECAVEGDGPVGSEENGEESRVTRHINVVI
ncbi:MAG: hypothetical protein ACE5D4_02605 [Thermodesulfobacteriota bacterium]